MQEQNSQAYARGTWDMRKEIEIMGKMTSINHVRFLRLWAFWTFNWFSCPIFDPMSWRCLASVLSISMHKCRVRPQSGVAILEIMDLVWGSSQVQPSISGMSWVTQEPLPIAKQELNNIISLNIWRSQVGFRMRPPQTMSHWSQHINTSPSLTTEANLSAVVL
jgi:hypothetical protein